MFTHERGAIRVSAPTPGSLDHGQCFAASTDSRMTNSILDAQLSYMRWCEYTTSTIVNVANTTCLVKACG